jgi:DNA-binding HxlR family transcriptional regulator
MRAAKRAVDDEDDYEGEEEHNGEEGVDDLILALSNRISLRIFRLASRGPITSKTIREKLDISDSVCHERLRHLVDLGLLMKNQQQQEQGSGSSRKEGIYSLTPLGQIVYQTQVVRLYDIAVQNNRFEVLAKIIERNNPVTELQTIAMRGLQTEFLERIENSVGFSNLKPIRFLRSFEDYTYHVRECIRNTKSELYLATRKLDFSTIQVLANLGQRRSSRSFTMTTTTNGSSSNFEKTRMKISVIYSDLDFNIDRRYSPQNGSADFTARSGDMPINYDDENSSFLFQGLGNNPNLSIRKVGKINWSFLVVDKEVAAIEITASRDQQFSFIAGFALENNEVAARLVSCFQEMMVRQQSRSKIDSFFVLPDIEQTSIIK